MSRSKGAAALLCMLSFAPLCLGQAFAAPLLWADFKEPLQSHSGAPVKPIAMSERAGDATSNPPRVIDASVQVDGTVSRANGSQWATLGIEVASDSRGAPVNLVGYETIRIRLSASTPRVLRIRLKGTDTATLNAGCYPIMMQRVGTQPTDYVIPLTAFGPEPYCGDKGVVVEQALPSVASVEVTANEPSPEPIRFAVGRIEFLRSAATSTAVATAAAAATPAPQSGASSRRVRDTRWVLAWSDEFGAPAGRGIDAAKWTAAKAVQPSAGKVRAVYADSARELAHDGQGHIALQAHDVSDAGLRCKDGPCTHASAKLQSRPAGAMLYGRMEVRFKPPQVPGLATTLSLVGAPLADLLWPEAGEIVLFESGGAGSATLGLHGPGLDDDSQRSPVPAPGDPASGGWRIAAVEWEPTRIHWLIDDVPVKTVQRSDLDSRTAGVFDQWPFLLNVGLAVGAEDAGTVPEKLPADARLLVDYVRVFQRDDLAAASRTRMATWQAQRAAAVAAAPAKESLRKRVAAPGSPALPPAQPVRQVTCERNNKYGLMMCY